MNIVGIEKLNQEQLIALEQLIEELKKEYLINLNLTGLKGIKIVDDSYLHIDSDGRLENNEILLPSAKTKKALLKDSVDNYESLKATIYHELVHLDFKNRFPKLHELYDKFVNNNKYYDAVPIQIWVEFNTEKESQHICNKNTLEKYMNSIINFSWDLEKEEHFIILKKHLPYIIVRSNMNFFDKNSYLANFKNDNVKNIIADVEKILYEMSEKEYLDDYNFLKSLCDYLMEKQKKYK